MLKLSLLLTALALPASAEPPSRLDFDVIVSLSPMAQDRLARLPEGILVTADYYGDPTPEAAAHVDQIGRIALAAETISLPPAAGIAHITGAGIPAQSLGWIDGPVYVNVNVASARQSGPDNILSCDFFDGALDHATTAPIELYCALITENVGTRAKS